MTKYIAAHDKYDGWRIGYFNPGESARFMTTCKAFCGFHDLGRRQFKYFPSKGAALHAINHIMRANEQDNYSRSSGMSERALLERGITSKY